MNRLTIVFISAFLSIGASEAARAGESPYPNLRDQSLFEFACSFARAFNDPKAADRCKGISKSDSRKNDAQSRNFSDEGESGQRLPSTSSNRNNNGSPG